MVEYFPQASTQDQNSVSSDSYIPPCPQMSFTPQIANFLLYSLNYELFKVRRTEYHIQLKAKSHERKDKVGKKIYIFIFYLSKDTYTVSIIAYCCFFQEQYANQKLLLET